MGRDFQAEHADIPAGGREQAAEHADDGGLAGTVGTEEAVDLSRWNFQVDAVHGNDLTKVFGQRPRPNGEFSHRSSSTWAGTPVGSSSPPSKLEFRQVDQARPVARIEREVGREGRLGGDPAQLPGQWLFDAVHPDRPAVTDLQACAPGLGHIHPGIGRIVGEQDGHGRALRYALADVPWQAVQIGVAGGHDAEIRQVALFQRQLCRCSLYGCRRLVQLFLAGTIGQAQ